jgi:hypothetical protein
MKETAVEWLVETLEDNGINLDLASEIIKQAKEMEKQQQGYSKEEVIDILMSMPVDSHTNIIEWFEQFKKK